MTAHTPGPWLVCQDDTDIVALIDTPSALVVASTKFFEGPSTSWERANTRLIAAAPELLDLAKDLFNEAGLQMDVCDEACTVENCIRVRAAHVFAQAEGRAHL